MDSISRESLDIVSAQSPGSRNRSGGSDSSRPATNRTTSRSNAESRSTPYTPFQTRDVIGTRTPRIDARAKVTGQATYTVDVRLQGMLYAAILRSPHPSAQVWTIDSRDAAAKPGVRAILTFDDKRVRHEGAEVAAIAADTLDQARDAIAALSVEYEVFQAVVTTEDAMAEGAPEVYEGTSNVNRGSRSSSGDVEAGLAEADLIIESTYRTPVQTHSPLETHCIVAQWTDASHLTVYISTQGVTTPTSEFADYFGIPEENVRVFCDYIGGGFGCKIGSGTYGTMAAELAKMAGAPVKLVVDRRGEQLTGGNRPDSIQEITVGAKSDGTLTAINLVGYATPGIGSGAGFGEPARSLYDVPNYSTVEYSVYTNCGTAMTMRAPGHPQGALVLESALDEMAYALGIDPLELRLLNNSSRVRAKEFELAAERFGWYSRNPQPAADTGPIKRGMGLASASWTNGGYGGSTIRLSIYQDGRLVAENNATDIGTGTRTWIAMLIAEELGLVPLDVEVRLGDSEFPTGPTAAGSTTTPSLSPSARHAGENARLAMSEVIAPILGANPDELVFEDGQITSPNGASIAFSEACSYLTSVLTVEGSKTDDAKLGSDSVFGVQFAEVEVDTRTGKILVKRIIAVHNAGRILNLLTAESQVIGGVIQGLNYALHEERVMDRNLGIMLNANLESYKIGGSKDMPEIEAIVVDWSSGGTYVGALGLGEAPTIPTSGAIANAVYHAIGARLYSFPMTPAHVLQALGTIPSAAKSQLTRRGGRP